MNADAKNKMPPLFLEFLKETINKHYSNSGIRVFLYGSRARGDELERSDWDIAFDVQTTNSRFLMEIIEDAPTLCGIDALFLSEASTELKEKILQEGVIIYEKIKN